MSSVKVITPPTDYPITIAGARDFLQVGDSLDDHLINFFLASATDFCEGYMQRALMPRTILQTMDSWPTEGFYVRWNPMLTITHIKYYDTDETLQTLDSALYRYFESNDISCISLKPTEIFPEVFDRPDAIQITYTAGYDPMGTIPAPIYNAILLETRFAYDFRTNEKIDNSPYRIASERLMYNHIIYTYRT